MIFQDLDAALNPNMRVSQILMELIKRNSKSNAITQNNQMEQLIRDVNLDLEILNQFPNTLSGGQKRRVAIAAVLALKPKIIIADEPTTGLDSYTQSVIMDLLSSLHKRNHLSIILISHDLQLIKLTLF